MSTIGIIGNGFVGNAVASFFKAREFDVRVFDSNPRKTECEAHHACGADFVFVCVPTPTLDGVQNLDAVEDALARIETDPLVVIKSTCLPGTCRRLAAGFPNLRIVYNPEFLSARTAVKDFAQPESVVMGGPTEHVHALFDLLEPAYGNQTPWPRKIVGGTWEDAELIKYARNTFYALKVAHWNEMFTLCEKLGVDFDKMKAGVLAGGWVSPMHCDVPGHDGQRGFGGACLPKDTQALVTRAGELGVELNILRAALLSNERVRDPDAV